MIALTCPQDSHGQHVNHNFFSDKSLEHGAASRKYDQTTLEMEIAILKALSYCKHMSHQDKNFSLQFSYLTL
jgi:hypothetical protein